MVAPSFDGAEGFPVVPGSRVPSLRAGPVGEATPKRVPSATEASRPSAIIFRRAPTARETPGVAIGAVATAGRGGAARATPS